MKILIGLIFSLSIVVLCAQKKSSPNILWITVEDMSPTLGAYGDSFAKTPFLDQFSKISVNYSNAFATAPVCSPSRSCLINGVYAQSQGTHQMRSSYKIPEFMKGFPALLRQAGYYTTNNVKTDYNSANFQKIISESWDESSAKADWRGRKKGQPFFSVINLMTTHQSRTMVWPYEKFQQEIQSKLSQNEISKPEEVSLPPYYPDTPIIRKTVARFYDCVALMDKEVRGLLQKLKDDGLSENTIVFFYSDHGSGMPRHKRALLDSGMKVPLMVYFPQEYKHLAPSGEGSWTDRLVSFVDFAPTVLSLCGQKIPEHMQGKAFLGKAKKEERKYIYGHRDRVDEVIDMSRSIRNKKYLYIRNFMPHISYNSPTAWPDLGEIRHEFYRLKNKVTMNKAQWHFVSPHKPLEELYDCEKDPSNLVNLADSSDYSAIKNELQDELLKHILKVKDLGFIAESSEAEINSNKLPWDFAQSSKYSLKEIYSAANDVGIASEVKLIENLKSNNKHVRYWGAVGLTALKRTLSANSIQYLSKSLEGRSEVVRIQSAVALLKSAKELQQAHKVLSKALKSKNLASVLQAMRSIELLGVKARFMLDDVKSLERRMKETKSEERDMKVFIGFSIKAFINSQLKK